MTHKKLINPTVSLYPASFPKTNMFSREWSVEQLVRNYYFIYKNCNIIGGPFDVYLSLDQGWVTLSADPRHLGALRRTVSLVSEGGGGRDERMDETHLSIFHSVSNHARGKRSSLPRLHMLSTLFFFIQKQN